MNCRLEREYLWLAVFILLLMVLTANIAWLNPDPTRGPHVRISETIPVLWQYNLDAGGELLSAAFFPGYFSENPTRVNRPLYPFLACVLGLPIRWLLLATGFSTYFAHLGGGVAGYLLLKFISYYLAAALLYSLFVEYLKKHIALLGVALTFSTAYILRVVTTYHMADLQVLAPIYVLWMFRDLSKKYSHTKNILYSLIVGLLILGKQNYAAYLAVLLFALWHSRWRETLLSVCVHLIPTLLWFGVLWLLGIPYHNTEAATYGQGTWLFTEFLHYSVWQMIVTVVNLLASFFVMVAEYFIFWPLFAVGVIRDFWKKHQQQLLLFGMLTLTTFIQFFAARRSRGYMTAELSIPIFGLAAMACGILIDRLPKRYRIPATVAIAVCWLLWGLFSLIHFPWIHPYQQVIS